MEVLPSLLVGKPLNIAVIATLFLMTARVRRKTAHGSARKFKPSLFAATAWLLYAGWEWLVQVQTPEANIRVDLLVIWPALALLSAWALFRLVRP